jgi:hypothetical protein
MRARLIDENERKQVSQLIFDIISKNDNTRVESGSKNQLVKQTSSGNTFKLKNKQSRKK